MSTMVPITLDAADDVERLLPIIEAVGSHRFGGSVLRLAADLFGAAEIFSFANEIDGQGGNAPDPICFASRLPGVEGRVESYCRHFAPFDTMLTHFMAVSSPRLVIAQSRLSSRPRDRYRAIFSDRSGLDLRVSLMIRRQRPIIVNLYFPSGRSLAPASADRLFVLAPAILSAIAAHSQRMAEQKTRTSTVAHLGAPRGESCADSRRLEALLAAHRPDMPTREREVCARTIGGMTAMAIAGDLGISVSTVATYRRRAYQRMGICSAYELVGSLMRSPVAGFALRDEPMTLAA